MARTRHSRRLSRRRFRLCQPCGKLRFATAQLAREWLDTVSSDHHLNSTVQRVYECPHGWFHLTSQPERRR
jgi:hypothetical protein